MLSRSTSSFIKRLLKRDSLLLYSGFRLPNGTFSQASNASTIFARPLSHYSGPINATSRRQSSSDSRQKLSNIQDDLDIFQADTTDALKQDFEGPEEAVPIRDHQSFSTAVLAGAAREAKAANLSKAWHNLEFFVRRLRGDPSFPGFIRACNVYFFCATRADQSHKNSADVLADLIDLGFAPNIATYTILVSNAAAVDDPGTAWEIYNMVRSYGISPDDCMYCVILNMCRHTGNLEAYKKIYYQHIDPQARTHIDPRLVTEILIGNAWLHVQGDYGFEHQLKIYERFCDLAPLKKLDVLPQNYVSRYRDWQTSEPQVPRSWALNVMIRLFLRREKRLSVVDRVFTRFFERIEAADPHFLPLLQTCHIYTTFLKVLSRWPKKLGISGALPDQDGDPELPHLNWRNIFRAISAPPPPHLNPETDLPLPQLRPDAYQWTTIASAYAYAGCVPETEAILRVMLDNGFKIPDVTWSALIDGFTKGQNVPHVASLLYRMAENEVTPSERNIAALYGLKEKDKLLGTIHKFLEQEKQEDLILNPQVHPPASQSFIDEAKREGW